MLALLKFTLSNLQQRIDSSLQNIFLLKVAIIVDKDFQEMFGILTQFIEYIQD
jgi:hypothetical protein